MFSQALGVALRILAFRAGPQDFPYSPQLPQVIVPLAVLANYLVFVQALPPLMSLLMAVTAVAGLALVTRGLLRARTLDNRYNQTLSALLACSAILSLMLLPPFTQVAPVLLKVAANPQLMDHPEALQLPQGAAFLMNLLNIWNFAVTVYIFRQAANVGTGLGVLITVFATLAVAFLVVFSASIASMLLGAGK